MPHTSSMKKIIYFLVCLFSASIFAYMAYESWNLLQESFTNLHNIMWTLGAIGWGVITFNIITNAYSWTKALCK